ncbi:MAG: hypothetical protein KatS3mg109_1031 [Pirellulaceae bacterium]|nr:MAG: hypothetical protein KatS3mg109_1031 [Pirellulaceae bacterium]
MPQKGHEHRGIRQPPLGQVFPLHMRKFVGDDEGEDRLPLLVGQLEHVSVYYYVVPAEEPDGERFQNAPTCSTCTSSGVGSSCSRDGRSTIRCTTGNCCSEKRTAVALTLTNVEAVHD